MWMMMSPQRVEGLHSPKYIPIKKESSDESEDDAVSEINNRPSVLKALFPIYDILKSAKGINILSEDYAKVWDTMYKWKEHKQYFKMDELTENPEMG
jgi:hypothetical protein